MTIDIINYNDAQFANLTEEQILEIKNAQARKDRLTRKLEETLQKTQGNLVERGIFNSTLYASLETAERAEYEAEVNIIREGLLFYLQYAVKPHDGSEVPYEINYAWSVEERFYSVRDYYLETYSDAYERFTVFKKDTFAPQYLGERYPALHDYFLNLSQLS